MINGKKNILEWFKMQEKPYFSIFRKGKEESGNFVYTNTNRENETMETASAYLDQCLSLISTGDFFIVANSNAERRGGKGRSETMFTISLADAAQNVATPAVSGTSSGGYDFDTMMQKAREMATGEFEKLMAKKEADDLKAKNAELQKENKELTNKLQQPWSKFMDQISPYVGSIAEGMGFKKGPALQGAISGHPESKQLNDNTELTAEQTERMNKAVHAFCDALAKQYPAQWISIIEKLTNTIVTEPAKIDMALKFL